MPALRLVLEDAQKVYRLSDLILAEDSSVAEHWYDVCLMAPEDNTADIKIGDENLSGLRYGYILKPGGEKEYSHSYRMSIKEQYVVCEGAANQELLVELH